MYNQRVLIRAYGDWIIQQHDQCWDVYYINIMFNRLSGSAAEILTQMIASVEKRFYPILCNQLHRHPGRKNRQPLLPRLILFRAMRGSW